MLPVQKLCFPHRIVTSPEASRGKHSKDEGPEKYLLHTRVSDILEITEKI